MTAAQAAEAVGTTVTADDLGLESCAENIKRNYKERYPEQTEMIEEIVDIISADEEFICIFEQEGATAFRIIEDSLRDVLEPAPAPISWDEDYYYARYYFPVIKQVQDTFCGAASIVMALMGGGKVNWTADTSITNQMQYEIATETGIWDPKTNSKIDDKGIDINDMKNYLQEYFPADSLGYTYQRKIFTRFHTSDIEGFLTIALANDTLPVLRVHEPQRLTTIHTIFLIQKGQFIMKKHALAIITAAIILGGLTACSEQVPNDQPGTPNSVTDSAPNTSGDSSNTANENSTSSSDTSSTESNSESEPIEKVRGVYGETEIPVIDFDEVPYFERHNKYLDSMVFETHELGDYKISLVGQGVWRGKITNNICADSLGIEVEKNGVKLDGPGFTGYQHEMWLGGPQYVKYTVIEDKIGSYLDVYDMNVPVIAMKYYFDYDIPGAVDRALMFATIQEDEIWSQFPGNCEDGTSLFVESLEPSVYYYTRDSGERARLFHPFGNDKFKIADGKTLIDEAEGIKYTFDFSDPMLAERYTAEKIV